MANIQNFKNQLTGGGARPNQFRVSLNFPSFVGNGILAAAQGMFLCKTATLPASTLENIAVQYRGRAVNFAGERTFEQWTVTIYNDTQMGIRSSFEQWSDGIQNHGYTTGLINPAQYQVDMNVAQLGRGGDIIKVYEFNDAYPINIGPVNLDFETTNQISTFDVTFQYNYWTSGAATTPQGPIIDAGALFGEG